MADALHRRRLVRGGSIIEDEVSKIKMRMRIQKSKFLEEQIQAGIEPTNFLALNKRYPSKQRGLEFKELVETNRKMQAKAIKQLELDNMKYKLFLTIKTQILKMIKDEELDKFIAILRRRKFTRSYIVFTQMI